LKPEALALPDSLLRMIPPRPPAYERGREDFKIRTYPVFDALAPAEAAAQHTLQFLFNPERAARLIEFHSRDAANPGLQEVLYAIVAATWKTPHATGYAGEVARTGDNWVLYGLLSLVTNDHATTQVRAVASREAEQLKTWLNSNKSSGDPAQQAHLAYAAAQIER